jgi:hypothetical protein
MDINMDMDMNTFKEIIDKVVEANKKQIDIHTLFKNVNENHYSYLINNNKYNYWFSSINHFDVLNILYDLYTKFNIPFGNSYEEIMSEYFSKNSLESTDIIVYNFVKKYNIGKQ